MAIDRDKVRNLILYYTNEHSFYKRFILLMNKRDSFEDIYVEGRSLRLDKDFKGRPHYSTCIFTGDQLTVELISHYSEEVFNVYVPADKVKKFIDDGYKLPEKPKQTYEERQAEAGFKVGDKVKVTRVAKSREDGWDDGWGGSDVIGQKVHTITDDRGSLGYQLSNGWNYPYFVLEKVEAPAVPPALTPFQKKGWTKDDKFMYNGGSRSALIGKILHLKFDDKSTSPHFWLEDKSDWHCCILDYLTKIDGSVKQHKVPPAVPTSELKVSDMKVGSRYRLEEDYGSDFEVGNILECTQSTYSDNLSCFKRIPDGQEVTMSPRRVRYIDSFGTNQPQPVPTKSIPQPKKETKMKITKIETVTRINDIDASSFSDDQIFDLIATIEADIKTLDAVKNKPKKLDKKIEAMQDSIKELVKIVDARD